MGLRSKRLYKDLKLGMPSTDDCGGTTRIKKCTVPSSAILFVEVNDMETTFKTIITTIGGVISWLVGGWGLLLTVLLILNVIDFITGMAANWGSINSKRGFQGVAKKTMMWVWIVVANLVYMILLDMGYSIGQVIPDGVALLFIINELVSLGENSAKLGLAMPSPVKKALDIFNERKEGEQK